MKERSSNFELLRLFAIFGIIIHHVFINNLDICGYNRVWTIEQNYYGLFANSLVVGGVNVFVLISGWFGIKRVWGNILRLLLDCVVLA